MDNFDSVSREERQKNIRKQRIKSIFSAVGFFAVIGILLLVQKCNYNREDAMYNKAFDAGYNLGYYVAFLEEQVVVYEDRPRVFRESYLNESRNFIDKQLSDVEYDGFRDGYNQGMSDGYADAKKFYLRD